MLLSIKLFSLPLLSIIIIVFSFINERYVQNGLLPCADHSYVLEGHLIEHGV